jgi:hypothetical protein
MAMRSVLALLTNLKGGCYMLPIYRNLPMQKPTICPGALAGVITVIGLLFSSQAALAGQDDIGIRNTGGGWYYPAYRNASSCREDADSGATCVQVFAECGPLAIGVYATMETVDIITNPNWGDYLEVAWVRNGSVRDSVCVGSLR